MPASSAAPFAMPSNARSSGVDAVLRTVAAALTSASLDTLAAAINRDDTTACRVRSEEAKVTISDAVRMLHAAGLKCVRADKICVDRETYQALSTIATKAMQIPEVAHQLVWDDEQQ